MKKLFVIRREDFFTAIANKSLPDGCVLEAGSIWMTVALTESEKAAYSFPISPA